jgi:Tfp pilus assembly protein PilV
VKVRLIAFLLVVAIGTLGLVWLHTQVMPYQAWASYEERWRVIAIGWATLRYAWPVGLAGLIVGGWAGLLVGGWLGNRAAQLDLAEQHQAAQQAQNPATLAETQANQAQTYAEARIAEITAQAQSHIAAAETRRRNAAGAAERRRRKLERLQSNLPKV